MTVVIPLSRGMRTTVDDEDAHWSKFKWYAMRSKHTNYAVREHSTNVFILLHRVITGAPAGMHVDHRDGDGLNNCRSNLRLATPTQNIANSRLRKPNSSGYRGVSWIKRRSLWQSQVTFHRRAILLGTFVDAEEAARAYDAKARELFGEFARLNFPSIDESAA